MDEELILPEIEAKDFVNPAPAHKKSKTAPLIFIIIGTFIALAGAIAYILIDKFAAKPEDNSVSSAIDVKYNADDFNRAMTQAEEHLEIKDYVAVEYYIKEFSLPERMTSTQKYRYFSILASLYSEAHLDDADQAAQYDAAANDALKSIRKGEQ